MTHSAFCVTLYTARFLQLILDTSRGADPSSKTWPRSLCHPAFYGADKTVQRIIQGPSKMCGKCTTCWGFLRLGSFGLCGPGWKGCVGRGGRAVWAGVEGLCVSPCNQTPHYNSISGPPAARIKGRGDQWSFPRRWNGPSPALSP